MPRCTFCRWRKDREHDARGYDALCRTGLGLSLVKPHGSLHQILPKRGSRRQIASCWVYPHEAVDLLVDVVGHIPGGLWANRKRLRGSASRRPAKFSTVLAFSAAVMIDSLASRTTIGQRWWSLCRLYKPYGVWLWGVASQLHIARLAILVACHAPPSASPFLDSLPMYLTKQPLMQRHTACSCRYTRTSRHEDSWMSTAGNDRRG